MVNGEDIIFFPRGLIKIYIYIYNTIKKIARERGFFFFFFFYNKNPRAMPHLPMPVSTPYKMG